MTLHEEWHGSIPLAGQEIAPEKRPFTISDLEGHVPAANPRPSSPSGQIPCQNPLWFFCFILVFILSIAIVMICASNGVFGALSKSTTNIYVKDSKRFRKILMMNRKITLLVS